MRRGTIRTALTTAGGVYYLAEIGEVPRGAVAVVYRMLGEVRFGVQLFTGTWDDACAWAVDQSDSADAAIAEGLAQRAAS